MTKTIVITGASDGIGAAAARGLSKAGHQVVVVGRSPERTAAVADELDARYFVADFTQFREVRRLAAQLDEALPRIDVLANNAGGVFGDRTPTPDGFETTFQVNHLAPFLLTGLLRTKLMTSRASVIQTSSGAARAMGRLVMDDLQHERDYTPQRAYGTAKLANILFTEELHRRWHDFGVSSAAFHPGMVASSFATQSSSIMRPFFRNPISRAFMGSPEAGAQQLIWLAEGEPGKDWESGRYYEKRHVASKMPKQTGDTALAGSFWDESARMTELGSE
ncbi:SDR family NAD(P)-dependent oxidoreductase [Streptomyces sp. NPDC088387]|uniref:SDR family NAD(P)-dependent oxidoreductase n=1 Tax=Streptomyces sp. NPDC088387 TaxID=3365859 RepID=UPI00382C9563